MNRPPRVILHVDMDAFFAQAELLACPALRGRPLIIGGRPGERGVVATASYEARPFGVRSGMPLREAARRCPGAVFLPCHPSRYLDLSARILRLLLARTPLVEMASIDEAFLEATDLVDPPSGGGALATAIQAELAMRLRLPCSVGIGPNKLIAKMASGVEKPGGICSLDRSGFVERFGSQEVSRLYGVGTATARKLERVGIARIEQLAVTPPELLQRLLGVWGPLLGAAARGEDDSPVVPYHETPAAKSLGHEYTLPVDVENPAVLRRYLLGICEEVGADLRAEEKVGETVHLKVRFSDFTTVSRQSRAAEPTASTRRIFRISHHLLGRLGFARPVRLIGVSVTGLLPVAEGSMPDLFEDPKLDALDRAADRIRMKFGRGMIRRATLLPEEDR